MTYVTRQDLADRYTEDEIAQRESVLPVGAVDRALADADAEIDSYLAGRYVVPLSPVPGNVARIACAIARYYLLGDAVTETARQGYEDAIAWLRAVQAGKARIETAAVAASTPSAALSTVSNGRDKAFMGGLS